MKNKGRKHKAGNGDVAAMSNCKSCIAHLTRPISSMSSKGYGKGKFNKHKWIKRMRGYLKSQTKNLITETQ